jgi:hypothetical protein
VLTARLQTPLGLANPALPLGLLQTLLGAWLTKFCTNQAQAQQHSLMLPQLAAHI